MFTGIVTDIGKIIELEKRGDLRARIQTDYDINTIAIGASIACDGICLTVIKTGSNWFDVEISAESVQKTHLKFNTWVIGAYLNLERSLRVGDENIARSASQEASDVCPRGSRPRVLALTLSEPLGLSTLSVRLTPLCVLLR